MSSNNPVWPAENQSSSMERGLLEAPPSPQLTHCALWFLSMLHLWQDELAKLYLLLSSSADTESEEFNPNWHMKPGPVHP